MHKYNNKIFRPPEPDSKISSQEIINELDKLAKEKNKTDLIAYISFDQPLHSIQSQEIIRLNSAFHKYKSKKTFSMLLKIILLWRYCDLNSSDKPICQALRVFGKEFKEEIGRRLLFTVSANGQEFRCWYGIPGFIDKTHVDSNAQGLLFNIRGQNTIIQKFVQELLDEETQNCVISLPNETKIYGLYWK